LADLFLIVNPAARNGDAGRRWPIVAAALQEAGLSFRAALTEKAGDATRLTAEALRAGARTVVAVGGDGTANEVANGFFAADLPRLVAPEARFGYLPTGTGTDLARSLGFPRHDLAAAISALGPAGRAARIDVARASFHDDQGNVLRRYFLVGADLGVGGETAAMRRSTAAWATKLGGFGAYLVAATLAIVRHQPRQVRYAIDDGPFDSIRADIIFVANGRYIGAGMRIAPDASLDDGLLDVLVLRAVPKPELLIRILPATYRGAHLKHPAVLHRRARRLRVEGSGLLLQMDGEPLGTAPAEFAVVPRALPILLPPAHL
jgi:YegS/Rv2252/BmrU family lipid kinase